MHKSRPVSAILSLTALVFVGSLAAQRGGGFRGPPAEVKERWGNYFATLKLETGDDQVNDLAKTEHVKEAVADGHLSVIYLYDSTTDPKKLKKFEQSLFNHNKIQPGLRLYQCARLDLSKSSAANAKYGKVAPVFFVFDKKGKSVGNASMKGFKPASGPLNRVLTAGTKGYSKVSLDKFVKSYGKWLLDTCFGALRDSR